MNKWFFGAGGAYAPSAFCPRKVNTFVKNPNFLGPTSGLNLSQTYRTCKSRAATEVLRETAGNVRSAERQAAPPTAGPGQAAAVRRPPHRTARPEEPHRTACRRRDDIAGHCTSGESFPRCASSVRSQAASHRRAAPARARSASYRTARSAAVRSGPTAGSGPQDADLLCGIPQPEQRTHGRQTRRTEPEQKPSGTEHRRKRKQARRIAPTACFPSNRRYRRNRISNV